MSLLFGWVSSDATAPTTEVVGSMAEALRVHDGQQLDITTCPGVGVGILEPPAVVREALRPVQSEDGRFLLWVAGEVVPNGGHRLPLAGTISSSTEFRRLLLSRWLEDGVATIADLDGDFQIAVLDVRERTLAVANDRFGGLPMYWASSAAGVAFGGGVRGVLMAPGVPCAPDTEALREAMTFGGYRLGTRTNLEAVRMVPGGSLMTIRQGQCHIRRYWSWRDVPATAGGKSRELVEEMQRLWRSAIARRLAGASRFGQTLSGGLDSRAILAEAAPRAHGWTAITYGVPGCDDAKYAERAARAVGATWRFYPLYSGTDPDWLERRTGFIQQTDGLIELGDLMHLEALDLQRSCFDVHLSGYVGDAVSGPTFAGILTHTDAMHSLPCYETSLGLPCDAALARVAEHAEALDGASIRFLPFEHKLPQSTNRWTAAWRPWLRVRKPFLDHAFFDFCQGLPTSVRMSGRLHERWLRQSYPACFKSIPNQRTGVPVLTPRWQYQLARVRRRAAAVGRRAVPGGWRPAARVRAYHDNDRVWREGRYVDRIVEPILRPGSLVCEILGRRAVTDLLKNWRATAAVPAQVVGALYVYEMYHRDLSATLARGRLGAVNAETRALE